MQKVEDIKGDQLWALARRMLALYQAGGPAARDRLRAEFRVTTTRDVPAADALRLQARAEELVEQLTGLPFIESPDNDERAILIRSLDRLAQEAGFQSHVDCGLSPMLQDDSLRDILAIESVLLGDSRDGHA
ncbi:hypothetical protein UFOVP786_7 [uncultured Caudovirales phage]|uniref:Uncharacterized protein n=1 Tax=uncultured Caudovirales phage TaxID=2100421 RepID=A0A6J5NW60_9CAUD|nr:hypothetical protein UFOVP786_7 [uncultured Caudovirales phage]